MAGERILLVDDEVEFVEALAARLETRGLVAECVHDGEQALAKVREHGFDAIVLDLAMPGMDGIETLRSLKEINPDLQVILLTGHGNLQSGIEAMKLGAMDFLEKPVQIDLLLEKLREAKSHVDDAESQRIDGLIDDILVTKGW